MTSHTNIDAKDALQAAKAFLPGLTAKVNNTLDELRASQQTFMKAAIDAAFSMASNITMEGLMMAAGQIGTALGSYASGSELRSFAEKEGKEISDLANQEKNLSNQLKDTDLTSAKKMEIKDQKRTCEERRKTLESQKSSLETKSNQKFQMYNGASQALTVLPQMVARSIQTMANSMKEIFDQCNSLSETAYQKAQEVVKAALQVDFLAGLVALGSINLR